MRYLAKPWIKEIFRKESYKKSVRPLRFMAIFLLAFTIQLSIMIFTDSTLIGLAIGLPISFIMFSIFLLITQERNTEIPKTPARKKGWAKIEDKSDGPLSWTEYTDHNGYVYTIYDMMTAPPTPGAYMKLDKESDDENTTT